MGRWGYKAPLKGRVGWECPWPGREEGWEAVLRVMGGRVGGEMQEPSVGCGGRQAGLTPTCQEEGRGGVGGGDKNTVVKRKTGWMEGADASQRTWGGFTRSAPSLPPFQASTQVVPRGLVSGEEIRASGRVGAAEALRALGWAGGGPHLVKEAVLADELLPGLGVDGDGEPHVRHQELAQPQGWASEGAGAGAPHAACASSGSPGPQPHPTPVHCGGVMPRVTEGEKLACRPALLRAAGMAAWGLPLSKNDRDENDHHHRLRRA